MLCDTWNTDIAPFLTALAGGGFDGVELSLFEMDTQGLKRVAHAIQNNGLKLSFGTGVGADTDISSTDKRVRMAGITYLKQCIDYAQDFGAEHINGVLYAPWFAFDFARLEERRQWSAQSLCEIAEYACEKDVLLNLEVLNRFESDFFNTLDQGSMFLKRIDSPNVRLLADTFHMNIEEDDIAETLLTNFDVVGSLHVCENHRGVPGTGHIPWEDVLGGLKKKGYDGWLTIESFVRSGTQVGNALRIWSTRGEPLEQALKGCAFLNEVWERV